MRGISVSTATNAEPLVPNGFPLNGVLAARHDCMVFLLSLALARFPAKSAEAGSFSASILQTLAEYTKPMSFR
jgi:hypothetical protein